MNQLRFIFGVMLAGFGLHLPVFADDKDVNVINTPNVNVANTPGVHVMSMPAVQISSSATNPVMVQQVTAAPGTRRAESALSQLTGGHQLQASFGSLDINVTDVIVSIQDRVGLGCGLEFQGGIDTGGSSGAWFATGNGVQNGIEKFHFDPPIPSSSSNPFIVKAFGVGSSTDTLCYAGISLLGVQQ